MKEAKKVFSIVIFLFLMISLSSNCIGVEDSEFIFLQNLADNILKIDVNVDSSYENVIIPDDIRGSDSWVGNQKVVDRDGTSFIYERENILDDDGDNTNMFLIKTTDSQGVEYNNLYEQKKFLFIKKNNLIETEIEAKSRMPDNQLKIERFVDNKLTGTKTRESEVVRYDDAGKVYGVNEQRKITWNDEKPNIFAVFDKNIGTELFVDKEENLVFQSSKDENNFDQNIFLKFDDNKNLDYVHVQKLDDKKEKLFSINFDVDEFGILNVPTYSEDAPLPLTDEEQNNIFSMMDDWKNKDNRVLHLQARKERFDDSISVYIQLHKDEDKFFADYNEKDFEVEKPNVPFVTSTDDMDIHNMGLSILKNEFYNDIENNINQGISEPKSRRIFLPSAQIKTNLLNVRKGPTVDSDPAYAYLLDFDSYAESPVKNEFGERKVWQSKVVEEDGNKIVYLTESILGKDDEVLLSTTSILKNGEDEIGKEITTYNEKGYREYNLINNEGVNVLSRKDFDYKLKEFDFSKDISLVDGQLSEINQKINDLNNKKVYDTSGNEFDIKNNDLESMKNELSELKKLNEYYETGKYDDDLNQHYEETNLLTNPIMTIEQAIVLDRINNPNDYNDWGRYVGEDSYITTSDANINPYHERLRETYIDKTITSPKDAPFLDIEKVKDRMVVLDNAIPIIEEKNNLNSEKVKLTYQKTELTQQHGKSYIDGEEVASANYFFDSNYNIFSSDKKNKDGSKNYNQYYDDGSLKEEITTYSEDGFDILNVNKYGKDTYEFVQSKISSDGKYVEEERNVFDITSSENGNIVQKESKEYSYDDDGKISTSKIKTEFLDLDGNIIKETDEEFVKNLDGTSSKIETEVSDEGYVTKIYEYDWEGNFPKKVIVKKTGEDIKATTTAYLDPITGKTILLESDRDSDGNVDAKYTTDNSGALKSVEDNSQEFLPRDLVEEGYIVEPFYGFVENPTGMKLDESTGNPLTFVSDKYQLDDIKQKVDPRDFDNEISSIDEQLAEANKDLELIKLQQRKKMGTAESYTQSEMFYEINPVQERIKELETEKNKLQEEKSQAEIDGFRPEKNIETIFDNPDVNRNLESKNEDLVLDKNTGKVIKSTEPFTGNFEDDNLVPMNSPSSEIDSIFDGDAQKVPVKFTDGKHSHYKTEYSDGSILREYPEEATYLERDDAKGNSKIVETRDGETITYFMDNNGGQKIITDDYTLYVENDGTETYFDNEGNEIIPDSALDVSREPTLIQSKNPDINTDKSLGETPINAINPEHQVRVLTDKDGNIYVPLDDPNVKYTPSDVKGATGSSEIMYDENGEIFIPLNDPSVEISESVTQPKKSSANQPSASSGQSSGYTPTLQKKSAPSSSSSSGGVKWVSPEASQDPKKLYSHLANFFVYLFKGDIGTAVQELIFALPLIGIFLLVFVVMKYISQITIFRNFRGGY